MALYPWRRRTIEYIKDYLAVTWTDQTAYERFAEFNWVYDKLEVSKKFCPILTIDVSEEYPKRYPAIIKPKSKLIPQSKVFVAHCKEDIDRELSDKTNYISQTTLHGEHITGDYVIKNGRVFDKIRFLCHRDDDNSFYLMERLPSGDFDIIDMVVQRIGIKSGIVNVETIGGIIINIHLTPTIGIHDISGGFTQQLPHFLQTGEWERCRYHKTFSRIYRRKQDSYPVLKQSLPEYPEGVLSVTLCWDQNKKLSDYYQDESSLRYMIINGTDKDAIECFGKVVEQHIEFREELESH